MALLSTVSRSNWNLEMLVFVEGGRPEYPEKNPWSKDKNQQQTESAYDFTFNFILFSLLSHLSTLFAG